MTQSQDDNLFTIYGATTMTAEKPKPSNETSVARGPYTATPQMDAEQAAAELRFLEVYGDPTDAIQRNEMRELRRMSRGGDSP